MQNEPKYILKVGLQNYSRHNEGNKLFHAMFSVSFFSKLFLGTILCAKSIVMIQFTGI